ncbi:PepSY-associated TM helix domain-containing protein [Sandaracinus amylolyticus]|uniref:Putative iron-regulated membrane protein n=1 Tax=Sandaracinus amylolyticus TaxID=927083 RepID=A0A0F6W6D1_9BACT|nr:PepSY-associated TM helix domain-containing protein [Sandaracinus amylolyticus]AKF08631.1 putative iron-regulated membrane protein [Sandaracinus amylolyticus]
MKLHPHAYTSWWDLHAWAGAITSIVLNVMFFAGAFALFYEEIAIWQDPRSHRVVDDARCEGVPLEPLVRSAIARFGARPTTITAAVPSDACAPIWIDVGGESERRTTVLADPTTGALLDERSVVATFLLDLHFLYDESTIGEWGMYTAGALAIVMLLTLVTGVLVHLKDLVRQLHQLRLRERIRFVWSDLHKVLGVMGLPFQIGMAFSGALLSLALPMMWAWQGPVFGGDTTLAERELLGYEAPPATTGAPGSRLTIDELVAHARRARSDLRAEHVRVHGYGDAGSTVDVSGRLEETRIATGRVRLRATDGSVVGVAMPETSGAATRVMNWIFGLHYARLGGDVAKLLYALLAMLACATILSGNWIWLARRDPARRHAGHRALARLTIAGGLGVAPAVGAMFLANRIAPIDASWHADAEVIAFVLAWALTAVVGFVVRSELDAAIVALIAGALAFAATPVASVAVTPLHIGRALMDGHWAVASVDVGLLAMAAMLVSAALLARRIADAKARTERLGGARG